MKLLGILFRVVLQLALGASLGAVVGALVTGDPAYTVAWAVGIPLVVTTLALAGSRALREGLPAVLRRSEAPGPRPASPRGRPGVPPWSRAVAFAIILTGAGLVLIPASRMIGWTASNVIQGHPDGNDMRTGLHQQDAVDDLIAVVGGSEFVSIHFYDSYVIAEAPTRPGADTTDSYQWRYGRAFADGPRSGVVEAMFDADRIDFSILPGLVADAKADAGWETFTTWYPSVRVGDDGRPEVSISLGDGYRSASYTYSIRGELIDRYGDGLE